MKDSEVVEVMARTMAFAEGGARSWATYDRDGWWSERPDDERDEWYAAARAALTALSAAGYVVVPRVATEGMIRAARPHSYTGDIWTAMVSAGASDE